MEKKNALSLRGAERAIEGRPGLLSAARSLTVTQAGGWWASDLHTTVARRLRRMGGGGQEMKRGCVRQAASGGNMLQFGQIWVQETELLAPQHQRS